jgi:hypothetical protein
MELPMHLLTISSPLFTRAATADDGDDGDDEYSQETRLQDLTPEEARVRVPQVIERIGLKREDLRLKTLEEYVEEAPYLSRTRIPLTGSASHLKATVRNVVAESRLLTPAGEMHMGRLYLALARYGFQFNSTKFHGITNTYGGPISSKITLFKGMKRVDFKGASNMLTVYLAQELLLKQIGESVRSPSGRPLRIVVQECRMVNIVAAMTFDFNLPAVAMTHLYKDYCQAMTTKGRAKKKSSAAQFQGVTYKMVLQGEYDSRGNPCEATLLFQDKLPSVTCVGCKTLEHVAMAFSHLYEVARQALKSADQFAGYYVRRAPDATMTDATTAKEEDEEGEALDVGVQDDRGIVRDDYHAHDDDDDRYHDGDHDDDDDERKVETLDHGRRRRRGGGRGRAAVGRGRGGRRSRPLASKDQFHE